MTGIFCARCGDENGPWGKRGDKHYCDDCIPVIDALLDGAS